MLPRRGGGVTAIECKWSASEPRLTGLASFRQRYPEGENWLVAADVDSPYGASPNGLPVTVMGLSDLAAGLAAPGLAG